MIFDSAQVAQDSCKEKIHEFDGYRISVKARAAPTAKKSKAKSKRTQLNSVKTFADQLVFIDKAFTEPEDLVKNALENLFKCLDNKFSGTFNLASELIGSVSYGLLAPSSDIDICLFVKQLTPTLDEDLVKLGEKTVRSAAKSSSLGFF